MQYDMSQILRLAQSQAGQKLISLLQQRGGTDLQAAITKASSGNYDDARQSLASLLSSQEAQTLLKQLEEEL